MRGRGLGKSAVGGLGAALAVLLSASAGASATGHPGSGQTLRSRAATASVSTVPAPATTPTTTTPLPVPTLSLQASPSQIVSDHVVTISGRVQGAPPASVVDLYKIPYPYRTDTLVRTAAPHTDGSFEFKVFPDRLVRYRAVVRGTSLRDTVQIEVSGRTVTQITALPLGRARVTITIFHPRDLLWGDARVRWSFATGFHGPFVLALSTRSHGRGPYAAVLRTEISLPAGHFRWRACFHAPDDQALLNPRRPPGCTGRGYYGGGYLPPGYPSPANVSRARSYLSGRIGRTGFAVVDSEGRMSGQNMHRTFVSASVVKAMLLVAYLRRLNSMGQHYVDSYSNSFLYPMINVSDNSAATQTWSIVGDSGLYSVARAAGMTEFSIVGIWANAQISPADQARFFFEMDSLIPREFVGYARYLLSTIAGYESWGIPAVARPRGYTVFFKGGWRGTGLGQLVHQMARLEGHHLMFSIAVMTDGDPSMGYGIDTIQGVTAALVR